MYKEKNLPPVCTSNENLLVCKKINDTRDELSVALKNLNDDEFISMINTRTGVYFTLYSILMDDERKARCKKCIRLDDAKSSLEIVKLDYINKILLYNEKITNRDILKLNILKEEISV